MNENIIFSQVENKKELQEILELQSKNLEANISQDELQSQGFVTIKHGLELLEEMNQEYPHIVAKANEKVVGYALVMLKRFAKKIPILIPMFRMIDRLNIDHTQLSNSNYFVMGQICIDKKYRGKGVFKGLYNELREQMKNNFEFIITEVATRNQRSLKAHANVGFKTIYKYESDSEEWNILIWNIK